jgi:hypothetical protein
MLVGKSQPADIYFKPKVFFGQAKGAAHDGAAHLVRPAAIGE